LVERQRRHRGLDGRGRRVRVGLGEVADLDRPLTEVIGGRPVEVDADAADELIVAVLLNLSSASVASATPAS